MALSPGDPNSYSRPEQVTVLYTCRSGYLAHHQVVTKHLHLDLEVDFEAKVLRGQVVLTVERVEEGAEVLVLDASRLEVTGIQVCSCFYFSCFFCSTPSSGRGHWLPPGVQPGLSQY